MKLRFAVGAALLGAACGGGMSGAPESPTPPSGERVYVANQSSATVSVIDVESGDVLETIDVTQFGFDANSRPHHTAVSPDGSRWYVSLIGGGAVLQFDTDNRLVAQAAFETPGLLAYDGANEQLYVGRSMMAVNPPQRIGTIDPRSMDIEELDVFFPRPHALAVDGMAGRIWAASLVENQVAVLDRATEDLELASVEGPSHTLVQFALSPDRTRLVATTQLTGKLLVFDATRAELPLVAQVDVGTQPWHPVFLPDGSRVYMGAKDDDAVVVVDAERWSVMARITAPGIVEPHGSAVTSDGRYVFVSNRNLKGAYQPQRSVDDPAEVGTVVKIDTATNQVVQTIEVGTYPAGISIGPAGS